MKISFDFDNTLTRMDVRSLAKHLISNGYEVWIVTARFDDQYALENNWFWIPKQNEKLYKIADELGIPDERIVFTNDVLKIEFLEGKNFIAHFDDKSEELIPILKSKDTCIPINVEHSDWISHYEDVIDKVNI